MNSPTATRTPHLPISYSVDEACEALGVGRTVIYGLLKRGALKRRKIGRRTIILRADLEAFVASLDEVA